MRPLLNRAECNLRARIRDRSAPAPAPVLMPGRLPCTQMGRAAAALSDAEAVCSQRPRSARAHVLRGRALLALCRYDAAEAAFGAAAGLDKDNAAAREGAAAVTSARGSGTDERARGNAAFAAQDYGAAVRHYSAALAGAAAMPAEERAVLLSNRSAAHLGLRDSKVREQAHRKACCP